MAINRSDDTGDTFRAAFTRRQVLKFTAGGTVLGLGGILAGPARFAAAQDATPAASATYPEVTITAEGDMANGYSFGTPDSFPTGYVQVTLENKSADADHHAMFMRPNDGVTADDFIAKVKASTNPGDFMALATSVGGPGSISQGQSATVVMNLVEGPYVLICEVPAADGTPHYKMGMLKEVDAAASGTPVTTAPTAETTVDLIDFAFDHLPSSVDAGEHIWEVHNSGPEMHEMAVYRLSPGVTSEAMFAILSATEAPATPGAAATPAQASPAAAQAGPPFISVAGAAPMSPDNTVWTILNLETGDYVSVCFIPDPKTGKPHFMLGMFQEFTVK